MAEIEMANRGEYTPIDSDDLTFAPTLNVEPTVLPSSVTAASGGQCANLPRYLFGQPIPAETENQSNYENCKYNLKTTLSTRSKSDTTIIGMISENKRILTAILNDIPRLLSLRIINPAQGETAKGNIKMLLDCFTNPTGGRKRTRRSGRKANKKTQRKQKKRTSKNIKRQKKQRRTSKR